MIRSHHDTTQRKSFLKKKNIDEVQENVDQMLAKVNNVDEKSTTRYKFRQFFFTSDVVSNENDDVTHFLNIEIVRQLKWWVNNHLNDFLNEFNELRIDRNKYLIVLANFQQFVKMYKNQKQNLFDIDNTLEKIHDKFKKIEKEKKRIKIQFIDKRIEYDDLTKKYETFNSKRAFHHFDEDNRDDTNENQNNIDDNEKKFVIDDSIVNSVKFSKKKRTNKHSNSNKFTNDVNSEWFTWKVNVHDKLTINNDWYEIAQFMITTIIDWIDEKTAKHIQSRRYNNLNYFESEIMMIFFSKTFMKIQIINVTYVENIENWLCSIFKTFNLFIRIFIVWTFKSTSINSRWWKIWSTNLSCHWNKFWTISFVIDSLCCNEKTTFNKCITTWSTFERKKFEFEFKSQYLHTSNRFLLSRSQRRLLNQLHRLFSSSSRSSINMIRSSINWSLRTNVSFVKSRITFEKNISTSTNIRSVNDTNCK